MHCTDIAVEWVSGYKAEHVVVQFILSRVEYELCASASASDG